MTGEPQDNTRLSLAELAELAGALTRLATGGDGRMHIVLILKNSPTAVGGCDMAMATNCELQTVITQLRWLADDIEARQKGGG